MEDLIERVAVALEPKCRAFGQGDMPMAVAREFAGAALAALPDVKEVIECLRWYVENDETNEGMPGNEEFEAGLNRARAVLGMKVGRS